MAKTRAQRKAERRKREAQLERQGRQGDGGAAEREGRAQQDTRTGASGEEAEFEAVMETGARTEDYGEHVEPKDGPPEPEVAARVTTPEPEVPEAPAPSRADVGKPDAAPAEAPPKPRESRRARKQREKQERREARAREQRKTEAEKGEKRRGPVLGFLASCWAELKRVQWPDRDTLVQASAVTLIFVAIMAAYLGALDAAFNWLIQRII
jgi:preprotein translocase SecE subunit